MRNVSPRSVIGPALLCAGIAVGLLAVNPVNDIWVAADQLNPRDGRDLWWTTTVIAVIAPVVGGVLAGLAVGQVDKKHYSPFMEGGLAAAGGLLLGVTAWSLAGGVVDGVEAMFASLVLAFIFLVLGGPFAFLVSGLVARKLAWG